MKIINTKQTLYIYLITLLHNTYSLLSSNKQKMGALNKCCFKINISKLKITSVQYVHTHALAVFTFRSSDIFIADKSSRVHNSTAQ